MKACSRTATGRSCGELRTETPPDGALRHLRESARAERAQTPYVLDLQNDHLSEMGTRVVVPLRSPRGFGTPAHDLNPLLDVDGKQVVMDTAALAPVPAALLKKPVAHLAAQREEVLDALDILFGAC